AADGCGRGGSRGRGARVDARRHARAAGAHGIRRRHSRGRLQLVRVVEAPRGGRVVVTMWEIVLIASVACLAFKIAGYLVPASVLEKEGPARMANLLTVALLSALVAVQTLAVGEAVQVDARVPAILVAAGLFALRVPFVLVVLAAAVVAALIRAAGWG